MSTYVKSSEALYEKIQKDIIEKIQKGEYKAGDRIPSEKQIVEEYKVSRITAIKALTELSLNGYIYRIQGKGSFANPLGKQLRLNGISTASTASPYTDGPRRIGLIIPEFYDYHSGSIITSIIRTLQYPDYFVDIVLSQNNELEEYALNYFLKNGFSGVILFPSDCEFYSDIILRMHLNKFPFVLIDRTFPGIGCNSVTSDNEKGALISADHLLSLGHTHIAFVADSTYKEQITAIRYNGYLHAILNRGLQPTTYENLFSMDSGAEAQDSFVQAVKSGNVTAIIASNSHVAMRLYALCQKNGILVPGDLSIVCFDNPNLYRQEKSDFFTYVDQDSAEIGKQASLILQSFISDTNKDECNQLILEPKLIINQSTCPPR